MIKFMECFWGGGVTLKKAIGMAKEGAKAGRTASQRM